MEGGVSGGDLGVCSQVGQRRRSGGMSQTCDHTWQTTGGWSGSNGHACGSLTPLSLLRPVVLIRRGIYGLLRSSLFLPNSQLSSIGTHIPHAFIQRPVDRRGKLRS